MPSVEKRKRFIINTLYFVLIVGAFYLFMKYAFWLCMPFLFAFFIAMLLQRPLNFVTKKTRLKKGFMSAVIVLFVVVLVCFLLYLLGSRIATEFRGLVQTLSVWLSDLPKLVKDMEASVIANLSFLPDGIEKTVTSTVSNLADNLLNYLKEGSTVSGETFSLDLAWLKTPLMGLWSTAKQVPSFIIAVVIALVACVYMTSDYDNIVNFVRRQLPDDKKIALSASKRIILSSLRKLVKSYITIIFITFVEITIGLNILSFMGVYTSGYIIAISVITAIVDILPVLGTGTILIPWAVISLLMGNVGLGIGLLVLYAVITVIRQVIEPKLVASNLGLSPVITIIGMYIGLQLFGFIGMFLVPVTVILLKMLNDEGVVHLWKTEEEAQQPQAVPAGDAPAGEPQDPPAAD